MTHNFSYKRLLFPVVLIILLAFFLRWSQTRPSEDMGLTNEQLKLNQQQWVVQNQNDILSRHEKLEPSK